MPNIQTVTYPNGNKILLGAVNKGGSSSCIAMLAYPFLGKIQYRNERNRLFNKNIWQERHFRHISQGHWHSYPIRIAIVRDPVERFISAYKDRVLNRNKDDTQSFVKDFDYFVNNIYHVRNRSADVMKHTLPLSSGLGVHPHIYTHIFKTSELDSKVLPIIQEVSGTQDIPTFKEKRHDKSDLVIKPTDSQIEVIKNLYKEDYLWWKDYF